MIILQMFLKVDLRISRVVKRYMMQLEAFWQKLLVMKEMTKLLTFVINLWVP